MYQMTALSLRSLLQQAYQECLRTTTLDELLSLNIWIEQHMDKELHFIYWYQTMELELSVLQFVNANCTANFDLYLKTLQRLFL